jgi:hypothetical protein
MKIKLIRNSAIITLAVCVLACKSGDAPDCFKQAGADVVEVRSFSGGIRQINIEGLIDVEIRTDNEGAIEVFGPEYLVNGIITEQDGGFLNLRNENTCNWVRNLGIRFKVVIHASQLEAVNYKGQGDVIFVDTLYTNQFSFENRQGFGDVLIRYVGDSLNVTNHTGYANFILQGSSRTAGFFHQGVGVFDAADFSSSAVYSNNSSINQLLVNSTGYLFAKLSNKGNTYYKGSPDLIDLDINGTGILIQITD